MDDNRSFCPCCEGDWPCTICDLGDDEVWDGDVSTADWLVCTVHSRTVRVAGTKPDEKSTKKEREKARARAAGRKGKDKK